jgi:membrane protein YqaA with SNARE-associated domain
VSKPNIRIEKPYDVLRSSWIRSSLILGAIIVAIGIAIVLIFKFLNLGGHPLFSDVKSFVEKYGLIGIFLVTILAGTVIPVGSPAIVVATASLGIHPLPLALIATAGFTIGMVTNYALAYSLGQLYVLKRVGAEKLNEISGIWDKWGWTIYVIFGLIPVLPVELLSFFCGLIKARFSIFLILSFIPRFIVFILLAYFGAQLGMWIGLL